MNGVRACGGKAASSTGPQVTKLVIWREGGKERGV